MDSLSYLSQSWFHKCFRRSQVGTRQYGSPPYARHRFRVLSWQSSSQSRGYCRVYPYNVAFQSVRQSLALLRACRPYRRRRHRGP